MGAEQSKGGLYARYRQKGYIIRMNNCNYKLAACVCEWVSISTCEIYVSWVLCSPNGTSCRHRCRSSVHIIISLHTTCHPTVRRNESSDESGIGERNRKLEMEKKTFSTIRNLLFSFPPTIVLCARCLPAASCASETNRKKHTGCKRRYEESS